MRSSSPPRYRLPEAQEELPFLKAEAPAKVCQGATEPVAQHFTAEPQVSRKAGTPGSRPRRASQKPPAKAALPTESKLLVGREEAAQMLSISVRGVDYLIATKRLTTRRIGTRVLIPVEDVRRFARSDHPERLAG